MEQRAKLESSSSGMEVNENHTFNVPFGSNSSGMNNKLESPSTASGELTTCIVEDSEEEDGVIDITDNERSLFGLRKVRDTSKLEGGSSGCTIVQAADSAPVLESDKRLGSKRRSPGPSVRVRRRLRSSSEDLHEVILCE